MPLMMSLSRVLVPAKARDRSHKLPRPLLRNRDGVVIEVLGGRLPSLPPVAPPGVLFCSRENEQESPTPPPLPLSPESERQDLKGPAGGSNGIKSAFDAISGKIRELKEEAEAIETSLAGLEKDILTMERLIINDRDAGQAINSGRFGADLRRSLKLRQKTLGQEIEKMRGERKKGLKAKEKNQGIQDLLKIKLETLIEQLKVKETGGSEKQLIGKVVSACGFMAGVIFCGLVFNAGVAVALLGGGIFYLLSPLIGNRAEKQREEQLGITDALTAVKDKITELKEEAAGIEKSLAVLENNIPIMERWIRSNEEARQTFGQNGSRVELPEEGSLEEKLEEELEKNRQEKKRLLEERRQNKADKKLLLLRLETRHERLVSRD